MGTLTGTNLVARARVTLLDPAPGKDWTDAQMLILLQAALRKLALVKNDAYPVTGNISMASGVDQVLPAGGVLFMKPIRNVTSGKPVVLVSEELLREEQRWSAPATPVVDVAAAAFDSRTPTRFLVDPPNDGTGVLRALYGATPTIAALADTLPTDDVLETPIHYLLVAEAYQADSQRKDLTKATTYETRAMQLLGVNVQSKEATKAALGKPGGS